MERIRILVANHSPAMCRAVKNVLSRLDCVTVDTVGDGKEALAMLYAIEYGLLITSWSLTGMCGTELTRTIRSDKHLCHTPVLMITERHQRSDITRAAKCGVSGLLINPFRQEKLIQTVESLLAGNKETGDSKSVA